MQDLKLDLVLWNARTNDLVKLNDKAGNVCVAKVLNSFPEFVHFEIGNEQFHASYEKLRERNAKFVNDVPRFGLEAPIASSLTDDERTSVIGILLRVAVGKIYTGTFGGQRGTITAVVPGEDLARAIALDIECTVPAKVLVRSV